MKKNYFILVILLIMVVGYAATQIKIDIKGNTTLSENTSDFNVYLANLKLNGTEIEGINGTKDKYEINVPSKGTLEYDVINDSTEYDVEAIVECEEKTGTDTVMDIPYTGKERAFYLQKNGIYKLETWGAEGGKTINITGGYGSYSVGYVNLNVKNVLYINIGGSGIGGNTWIEKSGGYNGGGSASINSTTGSYNASGGGATHIALKSGLLSTLENDKDNILIVSGGGAGGGNNSNYNYNIVAGSGGGYIGGNSSTFTSPSSKKQFQGFGGTQTSGGNRIYNSVTESVDTTNPNFGTFGQGGGSTSAWSGSGGGFYGGSSSGYNSGGGSGYIGNASLTNKVMYCYNCEESEEESTKTVSTTCVSETPTENCAKSGNGHVRITQVSPIVSSVQLETTTIEAQDKVNKSVEVSNKGMTCSLKIKKLSRTEKKVYTGSTEWTFDYTGGEQTFTAPVTGTYKLETWGAQGGNITGDYLGSNGAYTSGKINLMKNQQLYVYVGGTSSTIDGGYNGGGNTEKYANWGQGYGGGGATDVRLISGEWNNFESLKSRIMVSAGGGGASYYNKDGHFYGISGAGGGLIGYDGGYKILTAPSSSTSWGSTNHKLSLYGKGATQISGGIGGNGKAEGNGYCTKSNEYADGKFGIGGSYNSCSFDTSSAGGGSGYYGGGSAARSSHGAGGGSSFISGHTGCDAISEKSTETNIIHTGQSNHYSGYKFTDTIMIDGTGCKWTNEKTTVCDGMPSHDGTSTILGNTGNGYARITLIK